MQQSKIEELAQKVIDLLQSNQLKEAVPIARQVITALREHGQTERANLIESTIKRYESNSRGGF